MKSFDLTIIWRGPESLSAAMKLAEEIISKVTIEKKLLN